MKRTETCSCSLCNKLYKYLYRHRVVLDKYTHSNLVYSKHKILILSRTHKFNMKFRAECFQLGIACDDTVTYSLVVSSINCHYS